MARRATVTDPFPALVLTAGLLLLAGCGGESDAAANSAGSAAPPATVSTPESRYAGMELPDPYPRPSFTLTDTTGSPYDFAARTGGQVTLLTFGYTNCPDVCPTTMADIAVALRGMDPALARQVRVVFVTTDPARDDPARLRSWLDQFGGDLPQPFVGLTGSQQQIDAAQQAAQVPLAESNGQTHSALILAYSRDDVAPVVFDSEARSADLSRDLTLLLEG